MKIGIFNGGPRKNGRTAAVTASLRNRFEGCGAVTEEHFLYHMGIKGCLTCGTKSGLENARAMAREFASCDLVILATPIYMWKMTDSLKAFIDVLCAVCKDEDDISEKVRGKRVAAVLTTDVDENVAADAESAIELISEILRMDHLGSFILPFADLDRIGGEECQSEIRNFADKIMKVRS